MVKNKSYSDMTKTEKIAWETKQAKKDGMTRAEWNRAIANAPEYDERGVLIKKNGRLIKPKPKTNNQFGFNFSVPSFKW